MFLVYAANMQTIILGFSNKTVGFNGFTTVIRKVEGFALKTIIMCTVWANEFPSVMNHVKETHMVQSGTI